MIIELDEGERTVFERIISVYVENKLVGNVFGIHIEKVINLHGTTLTFSDNIGFASDEPFTVNVAGEWGMLDVIFEHKLSALAVSLTKSIITVSDEKPFSPKQFSNWIMLVKLGH